VHVFHGCIHHVNCALAVMTANCILGHFRKDIVQPVYQGKWLFPLSWYLRGWNTATWWEKDEVQ